MGRTRHSLDFDRTRSDRDLDRARRANVRRAALRLDAAQALALFDVDRTAHRADVGRRDVFPPKPPLLLLDRPSADPPPDAEGPGSRSAYKVIPPGPPPD